MRFDRNVWFVLMLMTTILFSMALVNAEQKVLGTYKQNTCVMLKQSCANCTFVNVTSVIAPDSSQLLGNVKMTKTGTEYNYSFCQTTKIGEYIYTTLGDLNGNYITQPISFQVNPSGNQAPLGLFIIVIVVLYSIGFIGFFGKHPWVSALGGMGMIALGLYTINNGIDIYRTFITDVFSWTSIGIGTLFVLVPLIELIQDNL